ncbi:VanW family protein [Leptospira sp. 2 VSF19]|uniref:VanW family protein n=1 Tax=Leptospira soteropolitanensis TaxID=2950025 RepID=A0AAW5VF44_9LEPT|nr:VanW family protein [Leptospira soteropolitanensis]MCW7491254.1 VanW family protein [Leptospira soteropolitanensis]MCW7498839.1 VanW family protein [Leptospira soteropolitanensis]MCW7521569.1 VanW family protein [Leptospira soteropolitanensis]MCW7524942.1 VanW family protein [Leptospira soteropolitanensis]MCW7528810.1 VanW family protein [Leptospira soteropolitanensis]
MGFSFKKKFILGMNEKVHRGFLRLFFGKIYFQWKRYIVWFLERKLFATTRISIREMRLNYPISIFKHSSPIYRKLKDVPMYLQENKRVNLNIAISKLDGIILEPNQVLSFWYLVGKPTRRKGYLPGMQLRNGGFIERTGGGLCQMANLIYWMTLHTPLEVKERWRHSFDIFPDSERTLPFGSGATLSYNYIDLQIKNTTKQPFVLHLWIEDDFLQGEWFTDMDVPFSYQVYESSHGFYAEPWGGYTRRNTIRRKLISKGTNEVLKDELVTENTAWMMYEPLLESKESSSIRNLNKRK